MIKIIIYQKLLQKVVYHKKVIFKNSKILIQSKKIEEQYDNIFSETISKSLGKISDITIKDEILALRRRLIVTMKAPPEGFDMNQLYQAYLEKDSQKLIELCKYLNDQYKAKYSNPEWPGKIFHLLRMVSGNLGSVFSLSALSSSYDSDRVRRADVVKSFSIFDVDVIETGEKSFTCPVSYEDESDVCILIKKTFSTILENIPNSLMDAIINNPLNAINCKPLIQKLVSMFDVPISLRTLQEAEKVGHPITISPLTRSKILGAIC